MYRWLGMVVRMLPCYAVRIRTLITPVALKDVAAVLFLRLQQQSEISLNYMVSSCSVFVLRRLRRSWSLCLVFTEEFAANSSSSEFRDSDCVELAMVGSLKTAMINYD